MNAEDFVHEYRDRFGRRWWVVARKEGARFYAPQPPRIARATGASIIFGPLSYVWGNSWRYRRKQDALRRARLLYG